MSFNLLNNPFFPVTTISGAQKWVDFADLAQIEGDYPIDFAWPRADFNVAAMELAIGVAVLALCPEGHEDWMEIWLEPPTSDDLRARLAPYLRAFDLDGPGPRFMQEFGGLEGEVSAIEALLIDTPGVNGQKKNADVLTHRKRYAALGLPTAAMALYALQQFAPSGGAGNRTSMRGGGPMTALVVPGGEGGRAAPLWRGVLANLPADERNGFQPADLNRILPWLAPTLTSAADPATKGAKKNKDEELRLHETDRSAHPLQAFFGMPRRIRLVFEPDGCCDATGARGPCVTGFLQKPWGVNYGLWRHPLTPYRRQKELGEPNSLKPKSARFGYRDWVAATMGVEQNLLAIPAEAIEAAFSKRARFLMAPVRMQACGWVMNNMEAVAYLDAEQPLHLATSPSHGAILRRQALLMADAADDVATMLRFALRNALYAAGANVATDAGVFDDARTLFYEATEDAFHDALDAQLADDKVLEGEALKAAGRAWLQNLLRAAQAAFAQFAPIPLGDAERAGRIARAFSLLRAGLGGYGKMGAALYKTLQLAAPESKAAKKKRGAL